VEWFLLAAAIASEVVGTIALRLAAMGRPRWYALVALAYVAALALLALTLRVGLALGVTYGIWSAAGVALIALASRVLFKEPLTGVMVIGIGFIVGGVLLIELGGTG
jgi:small multidrug resistance pump